VSVKSQMLATNGVTQANDSKIHFLTPEEAWETFDDAAQYYLHLSGREFIEAWEAGKFDDDPDRPAVVRVAMLRPLVPGRSLG